MIRWFKDLTWIVQIRWVIFLNRKRRKRGYNNITLQAMKEAENGKTEPWNTL